MRGWSADGEEQKSGWNFEMKIANELVRLGLHAYLSPRSLGAADLLASTADGTLLAIQAKKSGALCPAEWNALIEHAEKLGAIPVLAGHPGSKTEYRQLLARKQEGKPVKSASISRPLVFTPQGLIAA